MSPEPEPGTRTARASKWVWRRLPAAVLGVLLLVAAGNVAWWLLPPALEPLPSVPTERMEPEVRNLFKSASANVAMNSSSAAAWGELGAVFFGHDFEAPAQVCFRNAERLDTSDYRWPYFLGISLVYTDGKESLAAYRRAAGRCGQRAHVQLRLVETLLERGELDDAAAQIQEVLAYAPSNTRALYAQARLLSARGKLEDAKTWAERSVVDAAGKRAPYLLLAQLCRRTHDSQGEARVLAALEKIPDGFTPWEDPDIVAMGALRQDRATRLARAEGRAQSGDSAGATGLLHEMTGSDGSSAAAKLARTLNKEGKNREAETLLRDQLRGSPNDERLHFHLGTACFQQKKYQDAEAEYRRVIELKPDYVDARYNLGLTLVKLGKPDEARDAFAATVRLHPSDVFARIKLAELLLADGKREEAKEHLQAALKLAPEERQAKELLAKLEAGGK